MNDDIAVIPYRMTFTLTNCSAAPAAKLFEASPVSDGPASERQTSKASHRI